MNSLAAAMLAAGELVCEFNDGYRKSLLAQLNRDTPRTEMILFYEEVKADSAQVLSTRRPGRRPAIIRAGEEQVHLIEETGPSVRVTTLVSCERTGLRDGQEICTRFAARHAWHFDTRVRQNPDEAFKRQPSGAASGSCEPWRLK
jgi:hypothetical protein